ncbi:MAG: lysophospholipid acyltransferase family protein [Acidimicrobiia bacterium]
MSDWPGWARRLITIPILYLSWALTLALLPPLLVVALVIDLVRAARGIKPTAWRLLAFLLTYLTVEALGMVCGLGIWLASGFGHNRRRLMRWTYVAQGVWANVLWDTTCTVFRLRVSVSGDKNVTPGPLVVLSRHASIVDNILPFQLFTRRNRMNLRYVIKKELVIDPAIDIAGHWLPNHFVDRGGGDNDREIEALRQLATGLRVDDGIVIFPEGTRFTQSKQRRILDILERRNPRFYEKARELRNVLPPRPGGAIAILEAARADVALVAHHGLDGFANISDIWSGGMVGRHVRVRISRYPYHSIPAGRNERIDWLFRLWSEMDDWLTGAKLATIDG